MSSSTFTSTKNKIKMTNKNFIMLAVLLLTVAQFVKAQSNTFGLIRTNFDHIQYDSTLGVSVTVLDSTYLQLGKVDFGNSTLVPIGTASKSTQPINITSSILNPYTNQYIYTGFNTINSIDLNGGTLTNSAAITNTIAASNFDNYRFNNADSTIYGLARRNTYDSITNQNIGELYFAKIDGNSGAITQISSNSIGAGYSLNGGAINPYQMLYHYMVGNTIKSVDIYNGNIYASTALNITDSSIVRSFAFSCADTTLYCLLGKSYFTEDTSMGFPTYELDSTTLKLGKINPTNGMVTVISNQSISGAGIAINGGSTIDPATQTYYFHNGYDIIGVSLVTGNITSTINLQNSGAQYFDLMANTQNCYAAKALRKPNTATAISGYNSAKEFKVFPNPTSNYVNVEHGFGNDCVVQIMDINGRVVYNSTLPVDNKIFVGNLNKGIYLMKVQSNNVIEHLRLAIN
jgi:hypothetical protein